jgi:PAS domain S-box-containing protein
MTAGGKELSDGDAVLQSLREPVVALAPDGSVVFANRRFLDITQSDRSAVIGADEALLEQYVVEGDEDLRAAIDAVGAGRAEDERVECEVRHPEGAPVPRRLPVEIRVSPFHDDGGSQGVLLVFRDVSERARYERTLERQNARLDEFAGVISHDLRNPLNVATGRLELLAADCESEHLDAAHRALDRMDELIADLLTLARSGDRISETVPVGLDHVAERAWQTVETGDASLVIDTDARVCADEGRLRQLLSNLLQNAVEHGPEAPPVQAHEDAHRRTGYDLTVTVGELDDGFYVADDGCGIPAEECERVLQPGYTLSNGGTGLGLNIVADIADAHGWDLHVTGSADGGARFEFTGVEFASS